MTKKTSHKIHQCADNDPNPALALFASGNGSNVQAIIDACESGQLEVEISCLISDRADAYALERANKHGIEHFAFDYSSFENKEEYEQTIADILASREVSLIVLAGYMRLIGPTLLDRYKIVNIHPSLLPHFPGIDAIGQALKAGVNQTGVTIHWVDQGMDTGPIIAQEKCAIEYSDSAADVRDKIQKIEHTLYPCTLQKILKL